MSNMNNHGVDMNNDVLFQELSCEKAATIQGGYALEIYKDINFKNPIFFTDSDYSYIGNASNDQISSIRINQGNWAFYADANFKGTKITLGPGAYPFTGYLDIGNDTISSFEREP